MNNEITKALPIDEICDIYGISEPVSRLILPHDAKEIEILHHEFLNKLIGSIPAQENQNTETGETTFTLSPEFVSGFYSDINANKPDSPDADLNFLYAIEYGLQKPLSND